METPQALSDRGLGNERAVPVTKRKRGRWGRSQRAKVPPKPRGAKRDPHHPPAPPETTTPPLQKPDTQKGPHVTLTNTTHHDASQSLTNAPRSDFDGAPAVITLPKGSKCLKSNSGIEEVPKRGEFEGSNGRQEKPDLTSLPVFARDVLGLPIYPWQFKVLNDVDQPNSRVAAKCANGSGKTSHISAPAALWHPCCYQSSVTITTSGVFRQVKEQMWPQIRRMASRLRGFDIQVNQTDIEVKHGNDIDLTSKVVGFSTDDPGKFEGWHAESLLVILDESKTIPDEIFEAVERCAQGQPTRILMLSSPGKSSGQFYRAFNEEKDIWKAHTIQAKECPHINQEQTEALIHKWGIDHPLVRSMVFAEFMVAEGEELILTLEKVKRCLESKPQRKRGQLVGFCDFAAGGDENVLAIKDGNEVLPLNCWTDKNTMSAVGRFLQLFRKYNLRPENVFADSAGLGQPMCDALAEAGFTVNRVNNGSTANDPERYQNRGSEIWFKGANSIEKCETVLTDDPILIEQLTNRRAYMSARGKLCAESKDEMRARGVRSPDRADAVLGAITCSDERWDILAHSTRRSDLNVLFDNTQTQDGLGYDCGG